MRRACLLSFLLLASGVATAHAQNRPPGAVPVDPPAFVPVDPPANRSRLQTGPAEPSRDRSATTVEPEHLEAPPPAPQREPVATVVEPTTTVTTTSPESGTPVTSNVAARVAPPSNALPFDGTGWRILEANAGQDDYRWLRLTGFVQPGFIVRFANGDQNAPFTDSSPWLQRARFGVRAQLHRYLVFRTELEMTPTPTLQDAFVDVPIFDQLRIRGGQFIVPFLRSYSFNELNIAFIDRAQYMPIEPDRPAIRALSPRDMGVSVGGHVPFGGADDFALDYHLAMMAGSGANAFRNDDRSFLLTARLAANVFGVPVGSEAENDLAYNAKPRVGVGFAVYSNCDNRNFWNRGYTADVELRWRGLYFSAAYVWLRNGDANGQGVGDFLVNSERCHGNSAPGVASADFVSQGAHMQLQYVLPTEIFPVDEMALELLVRYDFVDQNSPYIGNVIGAGGSGPLGGMPSPGYIVPTSYSQDDNFSSRARVTFGVNWFPTRQQSIRFGINYQLNHETEFVLLNGTLIRAINNDILWMQLTAGF